jgi:hypothetical protein
MNEERSKICVVCGGPLAIICEDIKKPIKCNCTVCGLMYAFVPLKEVVDRCRKDS